MKKYQAIQSSSHASVLVYGGHQSLIVHLAQKLPGLLRFVPSTRHAVDVSSFRLYRLVIIFTANISHSHYYGIKAAAKRAGIPVHTMISKGSSTSAMEIIKVLERLT